MLQPHIIVEITDPDGWKFDVTDRLLDRPPTISETIGEDLLEIVHGDLDLQLNDHDGAVEDYFQHAAAADVYEIRVWRETQRRRPKYEVVFGGILELPWSLRYNRKDRTVSLQAFSYSKLLERASAEDIKRTVTGRTGTVSASSDTVTVNDTTDLRAGDTISLENSTTSEEQVIESVDSSTQVTTVEAWSNNFSSATLTLETPYYRDKSVEWLVEQLLEQAGIDDHEIDVSQELADYPVATGLNTDGITTGDPRSLVEENGYITATFSSGTRKIASSPGSGFSAGAASTDGQGDWRPYMDTEPASIVSRAAAADDGTQAWDHANGKYYYLNVDVQVDTPTPGLDTTTLELWNESGKVDDLDTYVSGAISGYDARCLDYDPVNNYVWYSFTEDGGGRSETSYYDIGGSSATNIDALYGTLRCVFQKNAMARYRSGTTLEFFDLTSLEIAQSTTVTSINVWNIRAMGDYLLGFYVSGSKAGIRVFDIETLDVLAEYLIATPGGPHHYLTVFDYEDRKIAVGYIDTNHYFVLAKDFAGTVDYADFDGMSCGAALQELALISMSVVSVDQRKHATFRGRATPATTEAIADVGTPLERESAPIWEFYKASVKVEGETEDGDEIEVLAGDTGDSARRLEIGPSIPVNESLATAIANLYVAFLSQERTQESVEIEETGTILRTFDRVTLDGHDYLVLEPEVNLGERTISAQLVSI